MFDLADSCCDRQGVTVLQPANCLLWIGVELEEVAVMKGDWVMRSTVSVPFRQESERLRNAMTLTAEVIMVACAYNSIVEI